MEDAIGLRHYLLCLGIHLSRPLAVLTEDTPEAAELVYELLYGLEYGMFA